jgi:hypothetical protein
MDAEASRAGVGRLPLSGATSDPSPTVTRTAASGKPGRAGRQALLKPFQPRTELEGLDGKGNSDAGDISALQLRLSFIFIN